MPAAMVPSSTFSASNNVWLTRPTLTKLDMDADNAEDDDHYKEDDEYEKASNNVCITRPKY